MSSSIDITIDITIPRVEGLSKSQVESFIKEKEKCIVLDIPDQYGFNDPRLVEICKAQYEEATSKGNLEPTIKSTCGVSSIGA